MSDRMQALRDALAAERAAAYVQLDPEDFEECIKTTDAALAALVDEAGAAQRPPVSPEAREEMVTVARRVLHPDATRNLPMALDYARRITDAILARFSVPLDGDS